MANPVTRVRAGDLLLGWQVGRPGPRVVPQQTVARLFQLRSPNDAQDFVRSLGLSVPEQESKKSATALAVHVQIDPNLLLARNPQVCLPHTPREDVPFGTVLVNFLIPPDSSRETAQSRLSAFQQAVNLLSVGLEANPAFGLTGYVREPEANSLAGLSFRLLYSAEPDKLFKTITEILAKFKKLKEGTALPRAEELALLVSLHKLPSLLHDVYLPEVDPTFVDLRACLD